MLFNGVVVAFMIGLNVGKSSSFFLRNPIDLTLVMSSKSITELDEFR